MYKDDRKYKPDHKDSARHDDRDDEGSESPPSRRPYPQNDPRDLRYWDDESHQQDNNRDKRKPYSPKNDRFALPYRDDRRKEPQQKNIRTNTSRNNSTSLLYNWMTPGFQENNSKRKFSDYDNRPTKKARIDYREIDREDTYLLELLKSEENEEAVLSAARNKLFFYQKQEMMAHSLLIGLMKIFRKYGAFDDAAMLMKIADQRVTDGIEDKDEILFALYLGVARKAGKYEFVLKAYDSHHWNPPEKASQNPVKAKKLEMHKIGKGNAAQEYMMACRKLGNFLKAQTHCNRVQTDTDIPEDIKSWINIYYQKLNKEETDIDMLENAIDPGFIKEIEKHNKILDKLSRSGEGSEKIIEKARNHLATLRSNNVMGKSLILKLMEIFTRHGAFDEATEVLKIAKERKKYLRENNEASFALYLEYAVSLTKYDVVFKEYDAYDWKPPKNPTQNASKFLYSQKKLEIYQAEKGRAAIEYMEACYETYHFEKAKSHFDKICKDNDIPLEKKFAVTACYLRLMGELLEFDLENNVKFTLDEAIDVAIENECISYGGLHAYINAWKKYSPKQIPPQVAEKFWHGISTYAENFECLLNTMFLWAINTDNERKQLIEYWREAKKCGAKIKLSQINLALILLIEDNTKQSFQIAQEIIRETPFNYCQTHLLHILMKAALLQNDIALAEIIYSKMMQLNLRNYEYKQLQHEVKNMFFSVLTKQYFSTEESKITDKYPLEKFFNGITHKNSLSYASYMLNLLQKKRFGEVINLFKKAKEEKNDCLSGDVYALYLLALFCTNEKAQIEKVFNEEICNTDYLNTDSLGIYLLSLTAFDDIHKIVAAVTLGQTHQVYGSVHLMITADYCKKTDSRYDNQTLSELCSMLKLPESQIKPKEFYSLVDGIRPFVEDVARDELNNSISESKNHYFKTGLIHDEGDKDNHTSLGSTQNAPSHYYGSLYRYPSYNPAAYNNNNNSNSSNSSSSFNHYRR